MTGQAVPLLLLCLCCRVLFAQQQDDVNVAPNKSYSQSTTHPPLQPSSMGANGDTSGYFTANCIETLQHRNNPWWQVDLGRTYPVQRIDVWSRHYYKDRLYPSTITVNDQTCASITSYPTDSRKKEVTCSSVMYGQTVRITRIGNDQLLNMCEMQIWVPSEVSQCEVGKYGSGCSSDCSSNCGKGQGKNFCYKSNGYCYDGCVDGWYGDQCSSPCSPGCQNTACDRQSGQCSCKTGYEGNTCTDCRDGYYKRTDNSECHKCSENCKSGTICDKITGYCSMCPPGKRGNFCTEDCAMGTYGQNCTEQCGHCRRDSSSYCRADSGVCVYGCLAGWQTQLCKTECPAGWYGESCAHECGSCFGGVACTKTNSHCRCSAGKQPPYCQTDCQGGRYGQDCAEKCGQCRGGQTCDPVTGHCSAGCEPGWIDPMPSLDFNPCDSECKAGRYGDNCTQPCGHCFDSHLYGHCDTATGVCPYKCQEGWKMPLCQQEGSDENDKETVNTYAVVGSVIAGAVILGVCIIILGIILKRRSGKIRQNENASNDTDLNTSPTTFSRRAQGEREKTTTDFQAAQEQEPHYEIAENTTMGTSSVHPQASISSDIQHCQSEADRATPMTSM